MPKFTDRDYGSELDPLRRFLFFDQLKWSPTAARAGIEIGCREGSTTRWFLQHLFSAPGSRLHCVDPWEERAEYFANFQANIAEQPAAGNVRVVRKRSFDGLRQLLDEGVAADMVYVDGSHTAPDVIADMVLAFRLLKVGGVMLNDDYSWHDGVGRDNLLARPKIAIDAFTTIYAAKIEWVRGLPLLQMAFTKTSE